MSQTDLKPRVKDLALLARLELTEQEVETYATQLGQILTYVETLGQVDVQGVAPLFHPLEIPTPLRADVVVPPLRNEKGSPKIIDSAPEALYDGYKVPPIL